MATLAEAVGQGAQDAQNQAGHSVGDALQAYHMAATAEHAKQELDMQKQDQDMNKAKWFNSQLDQLNRMPDSPLRQAAIKSFGQQAQTIYPGMNQDFATALQKDPALLQRANIALKQYASGDPNYNPADLENALSQTTPELHSFIQKQAEETAKVKAAQLGMAGVRMQMLEETKRQHGLAFSEKVISNPVIQAATKNTNSLIRSEHILSDPGLPVTAKDLNLAYQDYSNAVNQGGAATEGQIHRDLPDTWIQQFNELQQKAGTNADLRKTKAGAALIDQLRGRITGVKEDLTNAQADQAEIFHNAAMASGNPYVADAAKGVLQQYAPKKYAEKYAPKQAAQAAPPSAAPSPPPATATAAPTPVANTSHLEHLSTAELLKLWTAKQQEKQQAGGQ